MSKGKKESYAEREERRGGENEAQGSKEAQRYLRQLYREDARKARKTARKSKR